MSLPASYIDIWPPSIVELPTGRYAVLDRWYPIGPEVTIESLKARWKRTKLPKQKVAKRVEVPSSDGKRKYTVVLDSIRNTCTCTGFGFRGKCSHITKVLADAG